MMFTFYALRITFYALRTMIWHITKKELLVNLLSMRFAIGLVVTLLMMGLVGYVLVEDYAFRQQTYLSEVQRHKQALEQTKVYSMIEINVDIPPSPLSVFSHGAGDLPAVIRISPYHVPSLIDQEGASTDISLWSTVDRPYNPLLRLFASIDLSFVIEMILSLFALLLVFDGFTGEREQGTLKLLLSTSAGRMQLLIGKFLGAVMTMAIPLTLGFLEIMLLWHFSAEVALDSSGWAGTGLIYLFSLVCLAGFIALGLLVSLLAQESSSGLMYLLLTWVLLAVVIPSGVAYLFEFAHPRQTGEKLLAGLDKQFSEAYDSIPYESKGGWNVASMDATGGESILVTSVEEIHNRTEYNMKTFPLKFQYAEDRYRLVEDYAVRLEKWKRMRDNLIRPSLCVLYRDIVTAICGTGVETYSEALQRARRYRDALMDYLRPKVAIPAWFTRMLEYPELQPTAENWKKWDALAEQEGQEVFYKKIFTWDRVAPLHLSDMPRPSIAFPGLLQRMEPVMTDGLLLVGITAVFLVLALWRVLHDKVQ